MKRSIQMIRTTRTFLFLSSSILSYNKNASEYNSGDIWLNHIIDITKKGWMIEKKYSNDPKVCGQKLLCKWDKNITKSFILFN